MKVFWTWQWGARDMRRTWGNNHMIWGLSMNPAGDGGGRGGIAQQEV